MRIGIQSAFRSFRDRGIPIHILSAGIQQTIVSILDHHGIVVDSITANEILFWSDGSYTGVNPAWYIHVENKWDNISEVQQESMRKRSMILLLGDNPRDISSIPIEKRNSTLAVGFYQLLYPKQSPDSTENIQHFTKFMDTYDIVVPSADSDIGILEYIWREMNKAKK
jgi:Pyrimidine 5'-nucleotidase (UMPH-1)